MHMAGQREQAMDTITFAKYPFTQEASCYVKDRQLLDRGRDRQAGLRRRSAPGPSSGYSTPSRARQRRRPAVDDPERELLSYPVARIMVASTGDQYLIKRFALWESKWAYDSAAGERRARAHGRREASSASRPAPVQRPEVRAALHRLPALRRRAPEHRVEADQPGRSSAAWSIVPKDVFARLLEEAVREKVQTGLTGKVPEPIVTALEPYLAEIRTALDALKAERNIAADGEVSEDAFPPCMKALLSDLQKGVEPAPYGPVCADLVPGQHRAGQGADHGALPDGTGLQGGPDPLPGGAHHRRQRHRVYGAVLQDHDDLRELHRARTRYCEWVTHPLSYYRKAMFRRAKLKMAPVPEAKTGPATADAREKPMTGSCRHRLTSGPFYTGIHPKNYEKVDDQTPGQCTWERKSAGN